jgi:hypothetical protein
LGNAGELLAVGHGGAAAITLPSGGSPFSSLLPSNLGRPILIQRLRKKGTLSGANFAKETSDFHLLKPVVLGILAKFAFPF